MCFILLLHLANVLLQCGQSNTARDGGGDGGTAQASDYKNERMNEIFSHVM